MPKPRSRRIHKIYLYKTAKIPRHIYKKFKVLVLGLQRVKGYRYFIDREGYICRQTCKRGSLRERVDLSHLNLGSQQYPVDKDMRYLYYLDKQGDVSRIVDWRYKGLFTNGEIEINPEYAHMKKLREERHELFKKVFAIFPELRIKPKLLDGSDVGYTARRYGGWTTRRHFHPDPDGPGPYGGNATPDPNTDTGAEPRKP